VCGSVYAVAVFIFFCASIGIGRELTEDLRRRQTALALHSEFPSEISRVNVQTRVSFQFPLSFYDFDLSAPARGTEEYFFMFRVIF
jgi:hypothetical protein